jgi:RNA polymerase sigma-70 factor (ECF subfamily)
MTPETLARDYGRLVSSLARRMIRNPDTARDAAQEVWCELLKSLPSYRGDALPSTWIYTIARRTLIKYAQKEKTWSARFLSELFRVREDDGMPEMERIPVEDRSAWTRLLCSECLTGILHCLDNESRLIYLFRVLSGLSHGEIALVFGMEETAVRQIWFRSRRKINSFLEGHCFLFNPDGNCRCKLKEPIMTVDREKEYQKIRGQAESILFVKNAEGYLPTPDFWEQYLSDLAT